MTVHQRGPSPSDNGSRSPTPETDPVSVNAARARGGVGKSIVSANLALYLATIGRRVVLVDASSTGGNVHTCIGAQPPPWVGRDGATDALCPTPFEGLQLMHWHSADSHPAHDPFASGLRRLRDLAVDYAIVDMGTGLSRAFVGAYLDADLALFVLAPDPTSVENTYRFMRAAFCCQLLGGSLEPEQRDPLLRCAGVAEGLTAPQDIVQQLGSAACAALDAVHSTARTFKPRFVVNQTRLRSDLSLGPAIMSVARRRLGVQADYLGHIDYDDVMWSCVRKRKPVLLEVPGAKCSKKIEKLARRLLVVDAGKEPSRTEWHAPEHSHHELLELSRGATDEEIRRAFKRGREIYAHDALCCYGALDHGEIEQLRARLDEALDVLLDPTRRKPYELSVFPDEAEPARLIDEEASPEQPVEPMPELTPETQFSGPLLRKVREARRVSLRDISERTKVGMGYLKAIELEDFGALPALVYTSGFVTEFARFLRLDPVQVSRTYVRRYRQFLEDRQATMVQERGR